MFENSPRVIIWFLTFVPALALFGVAGYVGWRKSDVLRRWPSTPAEVVSAEVLATQDEDGDTTYTPSVTFRYRAGAWETVAKWNRGWSSGGRSANERLVAERFPAGSKHEIRYDPDDPARIECDVGPTMRFFAPVLILVAAGMVFLLGGVILYWSMPKMRGR